MSTTSPVRDSPSSTSPISPAILPTTENPSVNSSVPKTSQSKFGAALAHLKADITLTHADIPIIACCFVSGLCDSSAYNAWGCFVSMQTGNTIFLALGASDQPLSRPYGWVKSLISISCFLFGCFAFSNTRYVRPMARGTLSVSFFIQSACIIIAAALVQADVVPAPKGVVVSSGGNIDFLELLPLAFLAFQSGGQIVTSRLLGFNEVPTTVLTSVYCDLASDPKLLSKDNVKRNRRFAAVVCILVGGIIGGWISRSAAGLSVNLWIAAGIKMIITLSWSFWKPKGQIHGN